MKDGQNCANEHNSNNEIRRVEDIRVVYEIIAYNKL